MPQNTSRFTIACHLYIVLASVLSATAHGQQQAAADAALLDRLTFQRATTLAALQRRDEEPEGGALLRLAAEEQIIHAAGGLTEATTTRQAEIDAARTAAIESLLLRDESFAIDLHAFRETAELCNTSATSRSALMTFADGARGAALHALLTAASPAAWTCVGGLAADALDRAELAPQDLRELWSQVVVLEAADPTLWQTWGDVLLRGWLLVDARDAFTRAEEASTSTTDRLSAAYQGCRVALASGAFDDPACERELTLARQLAEETPAGQPPPMVLGKSLLHAGDAAGRYRWEGPPGGPDETLGIDVRSGARPPDADVDAARAAFTESLEIALAHLAAAPGDVQRQIDAGIRLQRLASIHEAAGDKRRAKKYLRQTLSIYSALVASIPESTALQRRVSWLHMQLGDLAWYVPPLAHDTALTMLRSIAARHPWSEPAWRDLSHGLHHVGDHWFQAVHETEGRSPLSEPIYYLEALQLRRAAAARNPHDPGVQRDLAASLVRLGQWDTTLAARAEHLREARGLLTRLVHLDPRDERRQEELAAVQEALAQTLEMASAGN